MDEKEKESNRISTESTDPSDLTTQLVLREIASLKELLQSRLVAVEKVVEGAHEDLVRVPTDVQQAIGGLQDLTDTKITYENKISQLEIKHIEQRFSWIEAIRVEQKRDTIVAVDAAFKAAKDALTEQNNYNRIAQDKSEAAFTKQIDSMINLFSTGINNISDKLGDFKGTVNSMQGNTTGKSQTWVWVVMFGSLFIGAIGMIVGIVTLAMKFAGK
jgi:hypothetical protein